MSFKHLSVSELKSMTPGSYEVLDIRDPQSYSVAHIPGSKHLTNENAQEIIESTPSTTPIVVCCYHGISSQQAAAFFSEKGFQEVYSLDGGFEAWELANK